MVSEKEANPLHLIHFWCKNFQVFLNVLPQQFGKVLKHIHFWSSQKQIKWTLNQFLRSCENEKNYQLRKELLIFDIKFIWNSVAPTMRRLYGSSLNKFVQQSRN